MKEKNKKIPSSEKDYKVSFKFDNKSEIDINDIIKESFINQLKLEKRL